MNFLIVEVANLFTSQANSWLHCFIRLAMFCVTGVAGFLSVEQVSISLESGPFLRSNL